MKLSSRVGILTWTVDLASGWLIRDSVTSQEIFLLSKLSRSPESDSYKLRISEAITIAKEVGCTNPAKNNLGPFPEVKVESGNHSSSQGTFL